MLSLTILRFTPFNDTNVKAFFDVEVDLGESQRITLYGLKLVQSKLSDELFVASPQRKGSNDKYYNHFSLTQPLTDQLLALAQDKLASSQAVAIAS